MKKKQNNSPLTEPQIAKLGETLAKGIFKGISQDTFKSFEVKDAIDTISTLISEREKYHGYLDELRAKHKKDYEYSKRYFNAKTKASNKSVKGIVKILNAYDSDSLISLYLFLKELPTRSNCIAIYRRIIAEANKDWGSPSYIVRNVLNGTKQELVSKRSKAYQKIAAAVEKTKEKFGKGNRHLHLSGVVSVRDGDHYIAFVSGGNNGHSNWRAYFESMMMILEECKHAWIIDIDNDCCDDVHYALIGFRISNKTKTRKEN